MVRSPLYSVGITPSNHGSVVQACPTSPAGSGIGLCLAFLLFFAHLVQAQTALLHWTHPDTTFADVQGYAYTLSINGTSQAITPDCVDVQPIRCTIPLPTLNGPTTLVITATNAFGSAAATYEGREPSLTNVTITITVPVP